MENLEPEIKAMGDVYGALQGLEGEMQQRVLYWALSKFSITPAAPPSLQKNPARMGDQTKSGGVFGSVADAFERCIAKTDAERVLVAASFLQNQGKTDLTAFEINSELKNLGLRPSNITDAISTLMSRKPQLMIQTRKEGSSRQAKKKYRVTTEGLKVATRLAEGIAEAEE